MNNVYLKVLILLLSLTITANAQDLANRIPQNAVAVASFKSGNFLDLISTKEFDNAFLGTKILELVSKKTNNSYSSINDFGLNLKANFYYYNLPSDSISYNCFLIPLSNGDGFDKMLKDKKVSFSADHKVRTVYSSDSSSVLLWNDEMALWTSADLNASFFTDRSNVTRYGMESETQEYVEVIDTAVVSIDSVGFEATAPTVEYVDPVVDTTINLYNDYDRNTVIKQQLKKEWTIAKATELFSKIPSTSILANPSYLSSLDAKAEATFWLSSVHELVNSYKPFYKPYSFSKKYSANFMNGFGNIQAKLFMEDKQLKMTAQMALDDEMAKTYQKIYSKTLNKKFLKYINTDKTIGYFGYAIDSKAYLEEMPKMIQKLYGKQGLGIMNEEMELISDFISLAVDEEAISKVIKGDGLFLLNGLTEYEVTYTDYSYNENFESTAIEKTKKETMPDFMFMFSSEDSRILYKLLDYGVKKGIVTNESNYYKLAIPKNPLPVYLFAKDGIFFVTTSLLDVKQINGNNYAAKIDAKHRNALLKNNGMAFFSPKGLSALINSGELKEVENLTRYSTTLNATGDIFIKSNPIKGNLISGEITMDVPEGKGNSVHYLISVIENLKNN